MDDDGIIGEDGHGGKWRRAVTGRRWIGCRRRGVSIAGDAAKGLRYPTF